MGCYAILQGIFLTQEWDSGLLHYRQILCHLSHREVWERVEITTNSIFSWERLVFEISKTSLSSCFQHFLFHLLSILWKQWNQTG